MENPSEYWAQVKGMSIRLDLERKELIEREKCCCEESLTSWVNWEFWNRGLIQIENADGRKPMVVESENISRIYVMGEEDLAWQRLASRFMQIGIPRRHIVLAGAICRCSPTVDSRKTLRQLKEGLDVYVEEVAGNWARVSSPVKGWVWRTHLKPCEDQYTEFEEDTVDTPGSFAETPGHSTPNLDSLAESRGVDSLTFIDDIYDSDSLCGLRPTIQQHQSIGSKTGSHTYSDNERRSISSDFSCIMENFGIGESVAIRDTIDQPWMYGKVCRTLNGTVLIQRNGFAGMTSWRHVKRVPMQKNSKNASNENDKVKMITIKKKGKEERIGLEIDHSKLTVTVVAEGSPAKRAGMKKGMSIRSICGMNVSTILDVRALLKQSGMELDVGVCSDECSISESDSQGSSCSITAPVSPLQATSGVLGQIRGDGYACLPPVGFQGGGWCWPVAANHSIATRFGFTPDIYFHLLSLPESTKKLLLILFKHCTCSEIPPQLFGTITHYIRSPTSAPSGA